MVPKWLTSYLANYVINQWSTASGPIGNPSGFEVLYLAKYFGGFTYFISHDIKNRFKNTVTLHRGLKIRIYPILSHHHSPMDDAMF